MSVIWIVEGSDDPLYAGALMGDYAVRLFASVESFQRLLRINRRNLPDLLLVHKNACAWEAKRLQDTVAYYMPQVLCVLAGDFPPGGLPLLNDFSSPGELSHQISQLLCGHKGDRSKNRGVLRYRDLQLNFAQVECTIVPDGRANSLPLKEAQLLKLLMEQPGVCISREEIQNIVWSDLKVSSRTVDSHISRLRKRIDAAEVCIESVYGGGYILR